MVNPKWSAPLLAIFVIFISAITFFAALIPSLIFLTLVYFAYRRGATTHRVSRFGSIAATLLGVITIIAFHQANAWPGYLISVSVIIAFGIVGWIYAYLLGLAMGKLPRRV